MITKYQIIQQGRRYGDDERVEEPFDSRQEAMKTIQSHLEDCADLLGSPPVFYIIEIYTVEEI